MPVNMGSGWLDNAAHTGPGQGWAQRPQGSSCLGSGLPTPPYPWSGLGPGRAFLPLPPGLMQSLPACSWLGAPGQAWVPGPGGKGFRGTLPPPPPGMTSPLELAQPAEASALLLQLHSTQ